MNLNDASPALLRQLKQRLGPKGFTDDPDDMSAWLTDWRGRITGGAAAMLSPASREEVADIVRMAAAERVPIVPQGGNTSMVAGATPRPGSLLLSLRRMNSIRALQPEENVATVEAGVILIGGLISTNAGGTQVLRFGPMRALVMGIEAVMPDGSLFEGLSALQKDNRGYDLRQLFAGAEGTLGIVTAAALRLEPAIEQRVVVWAGMSSPEHALHALRALEKRLGDAVEGFELVPDQALALVLRHIDRMRAPLSGTHGWHVLIEAVFPRAAEANDQVEQALAGLIEQGIVEDAAVAANEAQAEAFWALRENISEAERLDGISVKHDISVPVSVMPGFMQSAAREVEAAFSGARVLAFGHLGDGNVHFNVRSPEGLAARPWFDANNEAVSRMVHDLVTEAGGSISAEHGIGQLKLAEFARLGGAARLDALRAIKHALDPIGIMNPGKLVPLASVTSAP